jgi:peptidoglycan/LPS O-acetylase OafA/YrhL
MSHKNNFDLLRFAFAFTVLLVHAHVLSEAPALAPLSRWLSSDVAVKAFFVVSGFLVFMSYERSRSLGDYLEKRARRIYPAYATVVVLAAALGVLVSSVPAAAYFGRETLSYVAWNLVFLNFVSPNLPGVFTGNALTEVNGALWTLKIEVMFYAAVPLIAWAAARLGRVPVLVALYVASVLYFVAVGHLAESRGPLFVQLQRQLPGQLAYFMAGALGYYYADRLRERPWVVAAAAAAYALTAVVPALSPWLEPAALGALVVYAAVGLRYLGNFGRHGDFSYGIYIIHFPVIQTLVAYGAFERSPYGALAAAVAIVLALSAASWHLVEKPFLRKSSHYVLAEERRA